MAFFCMISLSARISGIRGSIFFSPADYADSRRCHSCRGILLQPDMSLCGNQRYPREAFFLPQITQTGADFFRSRYCLRTQYVSLRESAASAGVFFFLPQIARIGADFTLIMAFFFLHD